MEKLNGNLSRQKVDGKDLLITDYQYLLTPFEKRANGRNTSKHLFEG